jgi:putative acetyltransferase
VIIWDEGPADRAGVREVVLAAFGGRQEADLVDRLRADGDAEISLVAVDGAHLVGHVLFSPMTAPFRALGWRRCRFCRTGRGRASAPA